MASLIRSDLEFILQQILVAEAQAAGADPASLVPNTFAPFGLRTVDGSYNNLLPGQTGYGAADNPFPRLVDPVFPNAAYSTPGTVVDASPRVISNLIADMTSSNPAAVSAFVDAGLGSIDAGGNLLDANGNIIAPGTLLVIPNVAADEGLSAPFNSWFTFFGQFFDHGLDLINKSSTENVFIPLQSDDPLFVAGSPTNFMVVSRATRDANGEQTNQTTPFVDQNQTYTSHASHQVFLREYQLNALGRPVATGALLDGTGGGLANWAQIKAQALAMLGIQLDDADVLDVPLLATDEFGRFIPDPVTGFAQVVTSAGPPPTFASGTPGAPVDGSLGVRTGHAFLNDIAHAAAPAAGLTADSDSDINVGPQPAGTYDNELLDRHFITGDGRGNENIALTAVHHVFHSEHNRQAEEIKATVLATGDAAFIATWQLPDGSWNGERLFQAARFATEMQYQHLVFEEFARKMQPAVDAFLPETNYDTSINPAIVAEFAHAVFRVGHSMLTESVDRLDPNFVPNDISLINAFLNPVEFDENGALTPEQAAGAIVRGMTRQVGNEIDEFVTDSLRNSLLGLPLDLAAINLARGRDTGVPTLNAARREFYQTTADPQLKAYTSWVDLTQNLKHEASVVNFIAAYGTHDTITNATTLADKRAAATAIVFGGTGAPADRLDFLNSTGTYASNANGVTTTGVDAIDLWIGGLAEKQMPFGGLLGSTFNFVFESQMEALQNGDRFYYLSRLAGLNFLTEMENNTFAKLVMLNTDATHLPADIFSTPGFILEVNDAVQFTGLGADGRDDPTGGTALVALVIRDDPTTAGVETNYLQYTGGDHVVLGGTAGNDTLIASIGDDTLYGDGGNDRMEGGDGNDQVEGGAGDDIITDRGGDDVLKGNEGNDVIHGGNGFNLIIGGDGSDFIVTGEDVSEVFAGQGNDFILGSKGNLPTLGNEGHDWIELGTQDGTTGDSSDPLFRDAVIGNDVLISGGGFDELIGEGGDDIFTGSDGEDHFDGGSGFDWANYKFDKYGVRADMMVNDLVVAPVPSSNAAVMDRFAFTEGLSGSAFADVLRGDDADATEILQAGFNGSVLTNIALIDGLQAVLPAGMTSFGEGNIILGGDGSDIIEGRGGNDIIDGDAWLNVRIAVSDHPTIASVDSMKELVPRMLSGEINPGQLSIVREILMSDGPDFDTAMFSGVRANYTVTTNADGTTTVTDNVGNGAGTDGIDTLRNIERLQFSDQAIVLSGSNAAPVGSLTVSDDTPAVNQLLTVSVAGITDGDNPGGAITGPISYVWQYEPDPVRGAGTFRDIIDVGGGQPSTVSGTSFRVTAPYDGLSLRVMAVYKDANGVLETVFSAPTAPVAGVAAALPPAPLPAESPVDSTGVRFIRSDLQFILEQIVISERHANGEELLDILPNARVSLGLRTVDGSYNNLVHGQTHFGAADNAFPRLVDPVFMNDQDGDAFGPIGNTDYGSNSHVVDADPRVISNLIVDQTANNPAAAGVGGPLVASPGLDGLFGTADDTQVYFIPNTAPDEGLSSPFNAFMTFFGQFFDHGLDLVSKGGNGSIFVPLQPDDPLYSTAPGAPNFLVLTRATQVAGPGADGVLGTADDTSHEARNTTTPFIDQNQTYSSHPSQQVFLREYALNAAGDPVTTGRLITNRDLGTDGVFGTGDDVELSGMATWAVVKAQARDLLGIQLDDADVLNLPLLATDEYGKFIPDPVTGFAQIVLQVPGGPLDPDNNGLASGSPGAPIDASLAARTGHAFLDDIAHNAAPVFAAGVLNPDGDSAIGLSAPGTYDNELLDAHYVGGDGRVNENIALTAVHHVFHSEHNRLVEHTKAVILASNDPDFIAQWQLSDGSWNGERLFQAARFGTEMQYQHLVFEEFARKVQPQIDIFFAATQVYDTEIDPSIVAEFAHTVYRFGHSMLTETVDRFDAGFNVVGDGNPTEAGNQQLGLISAFLNPLEFTAGGLSPDEAAGALARGLTRQQGNEIDEFVTEALRNNLLGLPLDLATINILRGRDTGVPSLNAARRDFYGVTGDSQLKPYASWIDLTQNLKHEMSVVNFIAAYGTHDTITDATTLAGKRAAAMAIVFGGTGAPADRLDFLNGTGAYASNANGVTTTGVDAIDLWIGGLAEKQMPFGGLLGSTFNFVFEEQMEKLQDGDRFYYLERTQGLNFLTELENNTFARLIMANTDAKHLPGDVFITPGFTLEVDQALQFTGLGLEGRDDPDGGTALTPEVLRNNPGTETPDANYLRYSGDAHVVLGGTDGNDTIISSLGDDTLWGDAGNDRLEGGNGNDFVFGGAGDDIMTDLGGNDNMQGGDGNDAIHGGNGANLILGGHGNDFIVTGEDPSEAFGGTGNDFILGARGNEFVFGNEGDDWIERGMADGSAGENFDAFSRDQAVGHDVFIGNTISDRMDGEGGDDIMVGNGGQVDRYEGGSGFDWASFKDDQFGVTADLFLRAFDETPVPQSNATVLARFTSIQGMAGSQFADILRGDDDDAAAVALSGATGSVLTNIGLIDGLQELLDEVHGFGLGLEGPVTSFAGNIIIGGGGSDLLEGRGGDDIIDGDAWLNVRISVRENVDGTGNEIASFDSMTDLTLQAAVFGGTYNPGQLTIAREILMSGSTDFDTAVFSDVFNNYEIEFMGNDVWQVRHVVGGAPGSDGIDTVRNIERLQFSDGAAFIAEEGFNFDPEGLLTISDTTPALGETLTVSALGVTDIDNQSATNPTGAIGAGPISYFWQAEVRPGIFEDILIENVGGEVARATGPTFVPRSFEFGLALRVRAVYRDANDVLENVYSAATAPTGLPNVLAVGQPAISDTTPTEGLALTASTAGISDADGMTSAIFSYQWEQAVNTGVGGGAAGFTAIAGATLQTFTPGAGQVNRELRLQVSFTDDAGAIETVISAPTVVTGDSIPANNAPQVLIGNEGQDIILGGGGADSINGLGEDDIIDGGIGADSINGGAGNDTINYTFGGGTDTVDGGTGIDTLNVIGTALANALSVAYDGTSLTAVAGGTVVNVEAVNANLLEGIDTLTYTTAAAVTVDLAAGTASGFASIAGIENVTTGTGADTLTGDALANTLNGGGGDDRFVAAANDGNDSYVGGGGIDTYDLSAITAGVTITTTTTSGAQTGVDGISQIENFIGSQGDDSIVVNGGANVIDGQGGNDTIDAGGGSDTVAGGTGNDTINGGAGNDALSGGEGDDIFNYIVGEGTDTVDGGAGNDRLNINGTALAQTLAVVLAGTTLTAFAGSELSNVESIALDLQGGADTLTYGATTTALTIDLGAGLATGFNSIANVENVTGGAGNDTMTGGAGANTLNGSGGNDTFLAAAGDGNDSYVGGAGIDTYDMSATAAGATVTVNSATSAAIGADTLNTIENIIGSQGDDNITVNGSANFIDGQGGNDTINAGGGNDTVIGGAGNDTVNGDAGNDTFVATVGDGNDSYVGGTNTDTYDLSGTAAGATVTATSATSADTGTDTLNTVENVIGSQGGDSIALDAGNNVVDGQAGNDTLSTGAGVDRLTGGAGDDTMNGGAGDDVFVFAAGFGDDTIAGFDASPNAANAQDRLDVSALGINAGNFAASVTITDLGNDTLVEFDGLESILLLGVNGVGVNTITQGDFLLSA